MRQVSHIQQKVIVNQQVTPNLIYNLLVHQLLAIPILGLRGILNKYRISLRTRTLFRACMSLLLRQASKMRPRLIQITRQPPRKVVTPSLLNPDLVI